MSLSIDSSGSEGALKRGRRPSKRRLLKWIEGFHRVRILVVGDLIVDEFIWGRVDRISPEAPVPVVQVTSQTLKPGGAANVVNNLQGLGCKPLVCGVVGNDLWGRWLIDDIKEKGISVEGILIEPSRPTTLKTRVIAHNQQVVRIDRERVSPIPEEMQERINEYIERSAEEVNGIIVSDYAKGVVVEGVMEAVRRIADERGRPVAVDPKANRFSLYKGVTIITPNHQEAEIAVGTEINTEEELIEVGGTLIDRLGCKILLITRGEVGMTLFIKGKGHFHIPTEAREVYDVTGAGDTVISAFTLALLSGAPPMDAAIISNYAAGVVVGEVGTATVSQERLKEVIQKGSL